MDSNALINTNGLNSLISVINDYSVKIRRVLSLIDEEMLTISKKYDCESGKKMIEKYKVFKENYKMIYQNILTYKKDIYFIKSEYARRSQMLSNILNKK